MVSEDARTLRLLRERDALKRTSQVWLALTVVWGVVVGWAAWGLVNALTDDDAFWISWLVYLVPLAVLAIVTAISYSRLRRIGRDLLAAAAAPHPQEK